MAYPNPTYTDSHYTFTSPNNDRKYIKTLKVIADFNAKGMLPDRALVAENLHEPDPTKPAAWAATALAEDGYRASPRSNWGNSRWAALFQAGLITRWRCHGNAVHYAITPKGIELLALARDNSTASFGGALVSKDGQRKAESFHDYD